MGTEECRAVEALIGRARRAQAELEGYNQGEVDELVAAICWSVVKPETAGAIARMAVAETRMGRAEDKYEKLMMKLRGALCDMKGVKSRGVIEADKGRGITKIAKPVGVIGAILPCTNPEATPVLKAMMAIKGGNAVIFAPHPRAKMTNRFIVDVMRRALRGHGACEDMLIEIEEPSHGMTDELMRQCDLVVATGAGSLVKAAYSSGTPAFGVGQGNAVIVVDKTADLEDAAGKIRASKTFDYATSCSTENSLVVQDEVYDRMLEALNGAGGHALGAEDKEALMSVMWQDGKLNKDIVGQAPEKLASMAGIEIPEKTGFLVVEEDGVGPGHPFTGEKLSVVVAVYRFKEFEEAIELVNRITGYQGRGHSCGIHSTDEDHILELALKTKTSRVMVRQAQCLANGGSWTNGMPVTLSLGCGTWGGNISSDNITWEKMVNITWLSEPTGDRRPSDDYLFGELEEYRSGKD